MFEVDEKKGQRKSTLNSMAKRWDTTKLMDIKKKNGELSGNNI